MDLPRLEQTPLLTMRPSPETVAFAQLLAVPSFELARLVECEVEENAALELVDEELCPGCSHPLRGESCWICRDGGAGWPVPTGTPGGSQEVPSQVSLAERLLAEIGPCLPQRDRPVAEALVGSLDERGFLADAPSEIAASNGFDKTVTERVLRAIQTLADPPGLAARDVHECLLLQLERLEPELGPQPLARTVVAEHLHELARVRLGAICTAVGCTREEAVRCRELILEHLRPYPALDNGPCVAAVTPDIVIQPRAGEDGEFEVEVPERFARVPRLNPLFEQLAAEGCEKLTTDEREWVERELGRARRFLDRLDGRHRALRLIAEVAVERQKAFLRHGPSRLRPLTRAEVAAASGVHESTVSRAVAGRWVQLPNGRATPFAHFFHSALPAENALADLIRREDRALSDAELADELAAVGIALARRTVAKYRARLGILSSNFR